MNSGNNVKKAVVALGGNAITRKGENDDIHQQFANTRKSLEPIIQLIRSGYNIAIAHGNGPQVGNALLRVEMARDKAPFVPLGVLVADTEGSMGYMISQSLINRLKMEKIDKDVCTVITQVLVDKNDPSILDPTKYIGKFYTEEEAKAMAEKMGWKVKKDADRGWRRVVPSPKPRDIVESEIIRTLVNAGNIVIAAGGGGIPVYLDDDGMLDGVDAVVDKDYASAVLGNAIGAELLIIVTDIDKVFINFSDPDKRKPIDKASADEMEKLLHEGHFPYGSMGPKVNAAIKFIKGGGKKVVITSIENAYSAVDGSTGTMILR
ncbi:MAG: carbamate kinase [candidate division Zixibacteria bacterium]|nr:carbamate kinase [candidate division Zixibacteria bacterium]